MKVTTNIIIDAEIIFYEIKSNLLKAIGDTIALSVMSTKHLKRINLIQSETMTKGIEKRRSRKQTFFELIFKF